jgi:DNA-binding transcriptional LysR family regulator
VDLSIQQLRVLVAVADSGSFTAAGERVGLGQSSLSRTVAEVERRVGVRLFQRTTRRVVPTPEGVELVRVSREVLESFERGMAHFQGFLDGTQGVVRIAALPSLAALLLPPLVSLFREAHPAVRVEMEDGLLGDVVARIRSGHADLGLTVELEEEAGLAFRPLVTDAFYVVFPPGHALGGSEVVEWTALQGLPFVRLHPTSSVRAHVDRALEAGGIRVGAVTEVRNVSAVGGLVAAGEGISAVPGFVLPLLAFAGLESRPLRAPEVTRSIGVLLDPDRPFTPAAQAFIETMARARTAGVPLPPGTHWVTSSG